MADSKLEKALYGPTFIEVALGAVLGLGAGLLTACIFLVFKPIAEVKALPEEPVRGTVYYIPGSNTGAKSRTWSDKEKQFKAGSSVSLVEDELNAWAASTLSASAPKPSTKPGENQSDLNGIFNPGTPNFKITEDGVQIGFKCILNWYGLTYEVTVLTSGQFKKSGADFVFVPQKIYLGSCPLHLLPIVPGPFVSHLIRKKPVADELSSAWAKLSDVSIEGTTLTLKAQ